MSNSPLGTDRDSRCKRALLALDGLSVGDAFGQCFFNDPRVVRGRIEGRHAPPPPWFFTDDTVMAISIVRSLYRWAQIDRDELAELFAEEYQREPHRGYGGTAHGILRAIGNGVSWSDAAGAAFDGQGSMGNGGAMRVAPLGAWFADDFPKAAEEARASAVVTHAHPDGQAGAIAVAVAAAWAARLATNPDLDVNCRELLDVAVEFTPEGPTREGLQKAITIPFECSSRLAVSALGNGSRVISSDTVPFALWCAARHLRNYWEAMWNTVAVGGDIDTNCAIIGGIVALSTGRAGIPADWLSARERLPEITNN